MLANRCDITACVPNKLTPLQIHAAGPLPKLASMFKLHGKSIFRNQMETRGGGVFERHRFFSRLAHPKAGLDDCYYRQLLVNPINW